MFALATLAFVAVPVQYANLVFTTSTRWVFLGLLALVVIARGRLMFGFRSLFGVTLLAYCAWCFITSAWSEVPMLTIAKATAFCLVAVSFTSAGTSWVWERGSSQALSYLAPMAAVVLLAGLIAGNEPIAYGAEGMELYQGLAGNPNTFGILVVMALSFLLSNAYRYWASPLAKWIWLGLLVLALLLLARSHARAAMLGAGVLGMGFVLSLKFTKTSFSLALILGMLIVGATAGEFVSGTTYQYIYKNYLLKGGQENQGVLFSRESVWSEFVFERYSGGLVWRWIWGQCRRRYI